MRGYPILVCDQARKNDINELMLALSNRLIPTSHHRSIIMRT